MASIHPDISPRGISQGDLVDLLTGIVRSITGVCQKLDGDSGVPAETYNNNCYNAIFTGTLEDSKGNLTGRQGDYKLNPYGVDDKGLLQCLYEILDSLETLCEQLDGDSLTDTNYEALCYTAKILHLVENSKGNTLGNGTSFTFRPGGVTNQRELVELLYSIVDAWETLLEKLDNDDTVNDDDYESTWFTATITLRIENGAGSTVGNTRTDRG